MPATILDARPAPQGGVEVFAQYVPDPKGPCEIIYLAPYLLAEHWDGKALTDKGITFVEQVMANLAAAKIVSDKIAAVDAAIAGELAKRKAAAVDLYAKTPTQAVDTIFPAATGVPK